MRSRDPSSSRHGYPRPSSKPRATVRTGAGSGNFWHGRSFYLQIERCEGVSENALTVSLDEEKYVQHAKKLQDSILEFFDGLVAVEILGVPQLYAMEVRLMPEDAHPQHGRTLVGKDAELAGGKTIFSKLQSKKWPKIENIVQQITEFCRVPVRFELVGKELKPETGSSATGGWDPSRARSGGPAKEAEPLPRATLRCVHARGGQDFELHTDVAGKADVVFFPGKYNLSCEEQSNYDRLSPDVISVPARFAPLELTITASMKKQCTFFVIDHLNRPFPRFPLRLESRNLPGQPISVVTKANGRGKGRLGRGVYVASYACPSGPESTSPLKDDLPVAPFSQEFEVQDTDVPQFYRICVHRRRFTCEIMLRTRCDEPARGCPFKVTYERSNRALTTGTSSDIGVATFELPVGRYMVKLEPKEESPFVSTQFDLQITEDGKWSRMDFTVETKTVDVQVNLVTPDGEPAPGCAFNLSPMFGNNGSGYRAWEMSQTSDEKGVAVSALYLLEPYVFQVKASRRATEYMPQKFTFQTDRRIITIVVARSIFGVIPEDRVAIVMDTSGSMQAYIKDIKAAVNLAMVQQFVGSSKYFNILTFTEGYEAFQRELVHSSAGTIEDAMRFCESISAGGGSGMLNAIAKTLRFPDLEAMYIVTDGKGESGDEFQNRVRALYFAHPKRPKIHTISINCVPKHRKYNSLQALAAMTQGTFRPVCLEQDNSDATDFRAKYAGDLHAPEYNTAFELAPQVVVTTTDEETEGTGEDDMDRESFYDSA